MKRYFKDIVSSYESIVFLRSQWLGIFILFISFLNLNIALSGLLALFFAFVFIKVMSIPQYVSYRTSFFLNSLLVGNFAGFFFKFDLNLTALIFISVGLTLLITVLLSHKFYLSGFPLLSLPFSIVALMIAFASRHLTGLENIAVYGAHQSDILNHMNIPIFILNVFQSIGTIFCIPDPLFGMGLFLFVFFRSPVTALFFILGYSIGAYAESKFIFSTGESSLVHHGFNYALIFSALAGAFLIPSTFSLIWATFACLIGVLISFCLSALLNPYLVPVMALPFNLTMLVVFGALRILYPTRLSYSLAASPEAALERSRSLWLRHRTGEYGVFCPFEEEWTVQQGFDGEWTHRGYWKHALDFVIIGQDGKTFKNEGIEISDYFAFDKIVLSPTEGLVVRVVSNCEDNPIGKVENKNNWGNFIIIRNGLGFYVALAHLKKDSIKVKVGDFVTVGQALGHCGNSGYSQEPHVHIQVQMSQLEGAYTIPFHLLNYQIGKKIHFHQVPKQGETIAPLNFNKSLDRLLSFKVDDVMKWTLTEGKKVETLVFKHLLDEATGAYYWTDGTSRLYYSKLGAQFYFYNLEGSQRSPLWDLFVACPRIPLSYGGKLEFNDTLPLYMSYGFGKRFLVLMWQLISSRFVSGHAQYKIDTVQLEIQGTVLLNGVNTETSLKLDPIKGATFLKVGKRSYVRTET